MRLASLTLALFLSGCYSLTDCVNNQAMQLRDCMDAQSVWLAYRGEYSGCAEYPHYFGEGFKAGYRAVAAGGQGCPPPLPPRKYWSVCYQSESGKLKILNWYNGHAQGVIVAQRLGVQNRNQLVTGSQIYRPNCPVEIVIDEAPSAAPHTDGAVPHEMLPYDMPVEEPVPGLPPLIKPAPDPSLDASVDSVTEAAPPAEFPLPPADEQEPAPTPPAAADRLLPSREPKAGLPAPPTVQMDLPRPGENPRLLSITPRTIWPVAEATAWFELQSDPEVIPATAKSDEDISGRVRVAILDGSIDMTLPNSSAAEAASESKAAADSEPTTADEDAPVLLPPGARE